MFGFSGSRWIFGPIKCRRVCFCVRGRLHSLASAAGVDFSYTLYTDQIGKPLPPCRAKPGIGWLRLLTDVPTAISDFTEQESLGLGCDAYGLAPAGFCVELNTWPSHCRQNCLAVVSSSGPKVRVSSRNFGTPTPDSASSLAWPTYQRSSPRTVTSG